MLQGGNASCPARTPSNSVCNPFAIWTIPPDRITAQTAASAARMNDPGFPCASCARDEPLRSVLAGCNGKEEISPRSHGEHGEHGEKEETRRFPRARWRAENSSPCPPFFS